MAGTTGLALVHHKSADSQSEIFTESHLSNWRSPVLTCRAFDVSGLTIKSFPSVIPGHATFIKACSHLTREAHFPSLLSTAIAIRDVLELVVDVRNHTLGVASQFVLGQENVSGHSADDRLGECGVEVRSVLKRSLTSGESIRFLRASTLSTGGLLPIALLVALFLARAVVGLDIVIASAPAILVPSTLGSSIAASLASRHAQSHVGTAEHTSLTLLSICASFTLAHSLRLDALNILLRTVTCSRGTARHLAGSVGHPTRAVVLAGLAGHPTRGRADAAGLSGRPARAVVAGRVAAGRRLAVSLKDGLLSPINAVSGILKGFLVGTLDKSQGLLSIFQFLKRLLLLGPAGCGALDEAVPTRLRACAIHSLSLQLFAHRRHLLGAVSL